MCDIILNAPQQLCFYTYCVSEVLTLVYESKAYTTANDNVCSNSMS